LFRLYSPNDKFPPAFVMHRTVPACYPLYFLYRDAEIHCITPNASRRGRALRKARWSVYRWNF
jgi:hypothetical protein